MTQKDGDDFVGTEAGPDQLPNHSHSSLAGLGWGVGLWWERMVKPEDGHRQVWPCFSFQTYKAYLLMREMTFRTQAYVASL